MEAPQKEAGLGSIRVMVVDDSATARLMICRMLEDDPAIKVVGMASNGREAVDQIGLLQPDLVTMDVNMPVMDGIMAIENIMAYHPVPVLVVSSITQTEFTANAVKALGAGAVDVARKPEPVSRQDFDEAATALQAKVKILSRVQVITHPRGLHQGQTIPFRRQPVQIPYLSRAGKIVAIGSSTGGPQALLMILGSLPAQVGSGIVIVQHIAKGFTDGLVEWLNHNSRITVCKGNDGQKIEPGLAIIAPDGRHMTVTGAGTIRLDDRQILSPHKPSIDVMMESVARSYGVSAIGVILTGMGRDGALGIKSMHDAGSLTVAQDEESSVIFSMAHEAIKLGVVDQVLPLSKISTAIADNI